MVRTEQQGGHATGLGRQLQAAQGNRRGSIHFAQHRSETAAAQTFLHGPKNVRGSTPPDHEQASGIKTETGKSRSIEPPFSPAPQHRPPFPGKPRQHRGAETRSSAVLPNDLVQGGTRQTAPGQGAIDLRGFQGQHIGETVAASMSDSGASACYMSFESAYTGPQFFQKGRMGSSNAVHWAHWRFTPMENREH